ncbi:hypothetical protein ASG90_09625 [Nocardioides sp. Soil797]|nr:hypothetical protein ASG90_09625 [Nocardioides sp. Soil797]
MWLRRSLVALVVLASVTSLALLVFRATLPRDQLDTVLAGDLDVAASARGEWQLGPVSVELAGDGLEITQDGVTVWASDADAAFVTGARGRVTWQEHRGYFWPSVDIDERLADQRIDAVRAGDDRIVVDGALTGGGDDAPYTLTIERLARHGVSVDLSTDGDLDAVGLVSGRSAHAGVHGFGEQFDDFDLDGRLVPIVVREQGVGRGTEPLTFLADMTSHKAGGNASTTYAAWSSYVTDDLRGLRLDPDLPASQSFAVADTRNPDQVGLEVWAPRLRAELTAGSTPVELIARQQRGARPALARWTGGGAMVGLQGGTEEVRRELAELEDAGSEISAVWLQDWTGQRTTSFGDRLWWTWQLDRQRYPEWADLVAELKEKGIRTTTYVNPFLTDAVPKDDPGIRNLYAEAQEAGYLVSHRDGSTYDLDQGGFDAALVDLTNPDARRWFARVIAEEVLADGVDGFMADFAEGLPFDAQVHDGDAAQRHNEWPRLWAQTVRRACRIADKPHCVTWFRSGSLGMSQDAALFWNGDQLVDFGPEDGLASSLLGTFAAGVSGWPLVHSDVGGYTSIDARVRDYVRPDDLLQRWAEVAAFGVVMRTHEGNRPDENRQVFDADERDAFARMTRLFAALAPYRRTVVAQAQRTGVPAVRHSWVNFPDSGAADVDTQFFFGDSILVAPVLEHDADRVEVTFPPGRWVHLLTGEEFDGDRTVTVDAPLGTPAAFVAVDDPRADALRSRVARVLED